MYHSIIRPILFLIDPEKAHHLVFFLVRILCRVPLGAFILRKMYLVEDKRLERSLFGITFKNPVGLAAGFDKNAILYNDLANFGFGFIEIGTVTPLAQKGNPKKRLFRLKDDRGIINRMGFNNRGLESAIQQLKKNKRRVIIGANIGKNTHTKPINYTRDYQTCFNALQPYADYFVLNVSCPNVGSHAKLNDKDYLRELILAVQKLNNQEALPKPILLKVAPDLNNHQLDQIIALVIETKIDGVIASNTSTTRKHLNASDIFLKQVGEGGLSGQPVRELSTKVIRYLSDHSNKAFPIIGVGGIHSAEDAIEKIEAGADLVQVYTGFIYEGPSLIKKINKALLCK